MILPPRVRASTADNLKCTMRSTPRLLAAALSTGMALATSAILGQPTLEETRAEERAEFLQICQSLRNSYESYNGRLALGDLRGALAESASRDPEPNLRLRVAVGEKLIEAGRPLEAISILESAPNPIKSSVILPAPSDQQLRAQQLLRSERPIPLCGEEHRALGGARGHFENRDGL